MTLVPAAVQAIFQKSRCELSLRIMTIEEMVAALLEGSLDESRRAAAECDAHKLAGALGMFGLARGSELALELEHAAAVDGGPVPSEAPRLTELVLELRAQLDDEPRGSPDGGASRSAGMRR